MGWFLRKSLTPGTPSQAWGLPSGSRVSGSALARATPMSPAAAEASTATARRLRYALLIVIVGTLTGCTLTVAQFWRLGWRPSRELPVMYPRGYSQDFTPWPVEGCATRWRSARFVGEVNARAETPR